MTAAPRSALVAGASSGIGAAISRAFGRLGWSVAVGARRAEPLEQVARDVDEAGGKGFAHPLDLASRDSIDAFFDASERALGPVDVLVCNAAISIPGLVHELRPEDFEAEVAVNLLGPMLLARRALRSLRERAAGGDLVFVSSENAVRPRPYQAGYTATKMGLEGLARVLRMECEGTGIRPIIVRPGATGHTDFARGWNPDLVRELLESWRYWGVQRHLRWMEPAQVADAVVAAVTAPPGSQWDVVEVMPG